MFSSGGEFLSNIKEVRLALALMGDWCALGCYQVDQEEIMANCKWDSALGFSLFHLERMQQHMLSGLGEICFPTSALDLMCGMGSSSDDSFPAFLIESCFTSFLVAIIGSVIHVPLGSHALS